jgi:phospholipid/cholesterol/gamma-HCH transport system permease protein
MSASQELPIAGAEAVERGAGFHVSRSAFPGWAVPGGHLLLLWRCVRQLGMLRNTMVRLVFLRQVYFVGVMGLRPIGLLALAVGGIAVTQATNLLGPSSSYLYDILAWGLVTEAAPLFVALVMIGRNATVISTELALMRVRGEVRFLEQMGIDPQVYLALPRIVALSVSLFAVTFFYQVIAVAGGFGASALLLNVSFADQVQQLLQAVSFTGILFAMIKAFVFGVVIGTIACFAGLYAGDTINDVPRAQIVAYMRSLMWLVAIDLLFLLVAI